MEPVRAVDYNKEWAEKVGKEAFLKQHPEGKEWFEKTFKDKPEKAEKPK